MVALNVIVIVVVTLLHNNVSIRISVAIPTTTSQSTTSWTRRTKASNYFRFIIVLRCFLSDVVISLGWEGKKCPRTSKCSFKKRKTLQRISRRSMAPQSASICSFPKFVAILTFWVMPTGSWVKKIFSLLFVSRFTCINNSMECIWQNNEQRK